MKNGVLILPAGESVLALNAKTGDTIWTWQFGKTEDRSAEGRSQRSPMESIAGEALPNVAGAAFGEGLVFVGLRDGQVVALREATGEMVWATPLGDTPRKKGESIAAAPTYAAGVVLVGLANGDWALRGRVAGLDAKTGKKLWTFFTVPGPGEPGHDTWPKDNDSWSTGGAGVWLVGVVDADLGLAYFQTGNAVPMYGGEIRKGDNLYTASVVALDIKTGKLRWHYQVVRHDLWDADIATPLLLYDAQQGGSRRKALAAMRADGYLFLLDRETGKPLFPVEDRKVTQDKFLNTAPTQPFPVGADSLLPDCRYWKDKVPAPFVLDCTGFAPPTLNQHLVVASRCADSACPDHADVVQPADRLHLRAGRRPCRPRPPRQRRSMVPGRRRTHRVAARPGRASSPRWILARTRSSGRKRSRPRRSARAGR